MANPGQPTISLGATGEAVRRLERALRRTPDLGLTVDGVFSAQLETVVKEFQQAAGLVADGIVGPLTWAILPDGRPMPRLQVGSTGAVVKSLQTLLTNGAPGGWTVTPNGIDGNFGPRTKASVEAFQAWGGVTADGVVGDARSERHAGIEGGPELRHGLMAAAASHRETAAFVSLASAGRIDSRRGRDRRTTLRIITPSQARAARRWVGSAEAPAFPRRA